LRRLLLLVALGALYGVPLAGCAPDRGSQLAAARRKEAALETRCQALIDEGNALYRAKDYTNASKRYAAAAVVKPDDAAAYFGLGMALTKLGRYEDARLAYSHARALARRMRDSAAAR
jgi:Flp pilus assembly protein TadD